MIRPIHSRRRLLGAIALAGLLLGAAPVQAQETGDDRLAQAEEGMRRILSGLRFLMATIPQYALPEVLAHGDIIIRPVQPETPANPDDANNDGVEETAI